MRMSSLVASSLLLLASLGCRDSPTAVESPRDAPDAPDPHALAAALRNDPFLQLVADRVDGRVALAGLDRALFAIADRDTDRARGALATSRSAIAQLSAATAAPGDTTVAPTEADILRGVLDLAADGVADLLQRSASAPLTASSQRPSRAAPPPAVP